MKWLKSFSGWVSLSPAGTRWAVRGPIMGRRMFWLYRDGLRFSPTGRHNDALCFSTSAAAKMCAEGIESGRAS